MEFSGTFELQDATVDDVWLALSDPAMIEKALPGCQFLVEVADDDPDFEALRGSTDERELTSDPEVIEGRAFQEGGKYAALMELSVGSVSPTFEAVVTIDERDKPRMLASGEGDASSSSFEMSSGMELSETDDGGVAVEWWAEADVFGRIAQMGQRVINPVANRVVKRFFNDVQSQLQDLALTEDEEAGTAAGSEAVADGEPSDATGSRRESKQQSSGGILARIKRLLGLGG
jgi:carbon monoxide dehydrogenase subunit G